MSLAYVHHGTLPREVTDQQLAAELRFAQAFDLCRCDPWVKSLVETIAARPGRSVDARLRDALIARLVPYHAWHDEVPFVNVDGVNRAGILIGEQLSDHAPVTLGAELEHLLVYGPTGSGKSHLLAHLILAVLESET